MTTGQTSARGGSSRSLHAFTLQPAQRRVATRLGTRRLVMAVIVLGFALHLGARAERLHPNGTVPSQHAEQPRADAPWYASRGRGDQSVPSDQVTAKRALVRGPNQGVLDRRDNIDCSAGVSATLT